MLFNIFSSSSHSHIGMKTETIQPNTFVALRLPSDVHNILEVKPNTTINIGKYGSFKTNHIIGRPMYLTFEILDKSDNDQHSGLRVVRASELYADLNNEDAHPPEESDTILAPKAEGGVQYDVVGEDGQVVTRTNRKTIDDANTQILTMDEIEVLKSSGTGSGKELVAKILDSHSALDQKTAFALAKYTLRKTKKYLKRFTVLPLDVAMLAKWVLHEKEAAKIMEIRDEVLALIGSWSNVHFTPRDFSPSSTEEHSQIGGGRWLVIDDTAGLLTAFMAEKMGILCSASESQQSTRDMITTSLQNGVNGPSQLSSPSSEPAPQPIQPLYPHPRRSTLPSTANTLTLIHPLSQPNLSLLRYFHFDPFNPPPSHPLTACLKTLSWLQLLDPAEDAGYTEPALVSPEELSTWKSGKRGNYFRKRRRWERIKLTVEETLAGGFDGLVVASAMAPTSILHHLVPLLRGGAQVVIYSPHLQQLAELADYYSTARKTAFLSDPPTKMPTEDFPVDPRLLLAPTIQTARARRWQVLPGRTHPLMMGKGGAEGFVFTATRVLPAEGKVEARGKYKRRKVGEREVEGSETGAERKQEGSKREDGGFGTGEGEAAVDKEQVFPS